MLAASHLSLRGSRGPLGGRRREPFLLRESESRGKLPFSSAFRQKQCDNNGGSGPVSQHRRHILCPVGSHEPHRAACFPGRDEVGPGRASGRAAGSSGAPRTSARLPAQEAGLVTSPVGAKGISISFFVFIGAWLACTVMMLTSAAPCGDPTCVHLAVSCRRAASCRQRQRDGRGGRRTERGEASRGVGRR